MKRPLYQIIDEAKTYISDEFTIEDIHWLAEDILNLQKYELLIRKNELFDDELFLSRVKKASNIPVAYVLVYQMFCNLKILVDENVLIPRNETEELVYLVLDYIKKNNLKEVNILDVCAGSGCIALALKNELNKAGIESYIVGSDISKNAIEVARFNAKYHSLDVKFIETDCLNRIPDFFDIIVSNPPYIKDDDYVSPRVLNNEPHLALFAKENGLEFYHKIIKGCSNYKILKAVFFEIDPSEIEGIDRLKDAYLTSFKFECYQDINKFYRFISLIKE